MIMDNASRRQIREQAALCCDLYLRNLDHGDRGWDLKKLMFDVLLE